jgi:hypothetical protein
MIGKSITYDKKPAKFGLMAVSGGQPIGRSHEFGTHGLLDAEGNDAIDLAHRGSIDLLARNLTYGVELIRPARTP